MASTYCMIEPGIDIGGHRHYRSIRMNIMFADIIFGPTFFHYETRLYHNRHK
jgi:hypothetical protein